MSRRVSLSVSALSVLHRSVFVGEAITMHTSSDDLPDVLRN